MDKEDVRKRAEELLRMSGAEFLRHVEDRRRDRKAKIDRMLRRSFGATFDEKFENSDDVFKSLYADDVATRKLALLALLGPWGQAARGKCASRVEEMALSDRDLVVRSGALHLIGALFEGTGDARIGLLLATVVKNACEPNCCRSAAYSGLLQLAARPTLYDEGTFPEGIDWGLVDGYLVTH